MYAKKYELEFFFVCAIVKMVDFSIKNFATSIQESMENLLVLSW
jgi:hypothetical protein